MLRTVFPSERKGNGPDECRTVTRVALAGMLVLSLFPSGVLQLLDATRNGYWHARSPAFSDQPLITALEWARLPVDLAFILVGVVPLVIVTLLTYRHACTKRFEKETIP
jgi:nitric oxide reductase large subunit